ncbi:MAG: dipicolinate synthase subunit B [Acetobacteraceae bacterium]|nr:dipicolinate synthase subunit B [Acetobacteraceae bacterium]
MRLRGRVVGFGLTGSHCTLARAVAALKELVAEGAEVLPILSPSVAQMATRFGRPEEWKERVKKLTGRDPLLSIAEVEPIGPRRSLDVMVVAPCTGNTLAKLACAITDTPVVMACKAQLRNGRPVVLAVSTNDGLGLNARNLGTLLAARNVYFVPFGQDNPEGKPCSLDARLDLLVGTVEAALEGRQLQPLLVERWRDLPPAAGEGGRR